MTKTITLLLFLLPLVVTAQNMSIQGHRGARGLAPENTIPGFLVALDLGVNTLEMDVVISKDHQVVISHEPYFSSAICRDQNGNDIGKDVQKDFNLYEMDYEQIKNFDCGSKQNKKYPEQVNQPAPKPLLVEAIKAIEMHVKGVTGYLVDYNIEIKSSASGDNTYHPEVDEFSRLVYKVINTYLDLDRVIIQSFDFRVLKYWHENYPEVRLAALVQNMAGVDKNLENLGFKPDIYSPNYLLLNSKKISHLHELGIKMIPWTVNDADAMKELTESGVDGLITDYPDRAKELGLTLDIPYGRK
jgi:glycerophosphoryl diester phosphodiesterase